MPDTVMPIDTEEVSHSTRRQSRELHELFAALAQAQGEIEGAKKDAANSHFNSKYADLASVWAAVRGPLAKNGLAVMQWPRTVGNGVEVETILSHASGQFMSDVFWVPCSKLDAHGIGSATTYCRRFSLSSILGVAPEDDDGNGAAIGAPGQAGGGGDFRPVGRRPTGNMAAEAERDGTLDTTRPKGSLTAPKGKPTAAEKALDWTDKAIQTLNLSAQTVESLGKYWADNADKITWLEANAAEQHERLLIAFDNARDAAKAKVSA